MPGAVRLGDSCSGHGCWPSRSNVQGSPNVYINGLPAHRYTDQWASHCCTVEPYPCHSGSAGSGSPNVLVNGLPQCRIGDNVNCGSTMVSGSSNVFVNG